MGLLHLLNDPSKAQVSEAASLLQVESFAKLHRDTSAGNQTSLKITHLQVIIGNNRDIMRPIYIYMYTLYIMYGKFLLFRKKLWLAGKSPIEIDDFAAVNLHLVGFLSYSHI